MGTERLNNQKYKEILKWMRIKVPKFTFTIVHDETIVDVEQRRVMLFLKSFAPTEIGDYHNEYVWSFKLTDDGTEIAEDWEFMDSNYANGFFNKLGMQERQDPSLKDVKK